MSKCLYRHACACVRAVCACVRALQLSLYRFWISAIYILDYIALIDTTCRCKAACLAEAKLTTLKTQF